MKRTLILAGLLVLGYANAQTQEEDGKVSINTQSPKATFQVDPYKTDGTTLEGVLVPRLAKAALVTMKTNQYASNLQESTLVYVTDEVVAGDNTDFVGTGKGFYYYDAVTKKWTKLGAGAASTAETGAIVRNIKAVDGTVPSSSWGPDDFTVVGTGANGTVTLPDPSGDNKGRIISFRNQSNAQRNYAGAYQPKNNTTINSGRGHLLQSDGEAWYVIGGF